MAKAKTIGKFIYIPYKRKLTKLAQQNRNNPSPAEKKIWYEVLCRKQFKEYKFTRQKPIANFIVDYYCSKLQLVIEIDGDSHVENKEYDEARTNVLNQYGLKVLRYTNRDVMNNIEGVCQDLMRLVKPPLSPLSGGQKSKSLLLRRKKKQSPLSERRRSIPLSRDYRGKRIASQEAK